MCLTDSHDEVVTALSSGVPNRALFASGLFLSELGIPRCNCFFGIVSRNAV